ncbi:hypothetical protein NFHSH190041_36810 (plasmid) [Shewanella sp. NFH-SH190041]|uniref:head-tail joining protein n=1 Tax=Shewanella sp. NFH-SH190041 TaxID=2950245 RepID=UPI0021C4BD07|nr:hypothetical protein [Shewanella sp. NFH-SH190041]BDM66229.1 hypothetical protein NFHSH190041_36810 [Shewanella sp. NFH-SH190041]
MFNNRFDRLASVLDAAQSEMFGEPLIIGGISVTGIQDQYPGELGEAATLITVWQVLTAELPSGFSRGMAVQYQGRDYTVSRIHPADGNSTPFEVE